MNARQKIQRVGDDIGFSRTYIEWYINESTFDEEFAAVETELTDDDRQDISFDLVQHVPEFVSAQLLS